jgi:hypothetical protein
MITEIKPSDYRYADAVNVAGLIYGSSLSNNICYYVNENNCNDIIKEDSSELDNYKYYKVDTKVYPKHFYYKERIDVYLGSYKSIFGIFDDSTINDIVKLNSEE